MLDALRSPLSSPWALLALVGTCALLGAFHALTPGHGKALLASYLVGAHSTPRQAVALGSVITVTHTSSVIALGTAVLFAGQFVTPGVMVPILQVASGVVVLFLGVRLLRRRWPGRGRADQDHSHSHSHSHSHKGHRHSQEHEHRHDHGGPGHSHSHSPGGRHHHHPVVIPTTFRGIAALGVSGGIIPCPEALTVLLLAVGLGRTALGIIMIFAFSIGLAAVLVGLGLILVSARSGLERFRQPVQSPLMQWLPATSALVVSVLGLTIAVSGVGALTG
nr:sulfite exporter TauE/SafE family protein [Streptomyces sp. S3(2020)]